ncbi:MAG: hypothetical protein IJ062_02470 [Firmicutes bacterium]|nr:hypothetical protein [Bacillota bacterium]
MARKRRDVSDKRNPSRNIKIHDRDELLRRVMDERGGKRKNEKKSRRTEIREQVYSRRERTRPTERRDEKKDGKGSGLKLSKRAPKLRGFLLPAADGSNEVDVSRAKREERSTSTAAAVIIAMLLFLIVLFYAVGYAVKYMQRSVVANDTVVYGSIDSAKVCTGVVVRDEVVYNSPSSGEAVFNVADNDKVKANTEVCSVQDTAAVQSLQEDLNEINEKILEMQKTRESISAVSDEVKHYNAQIKAGADNYAFRLTSGDISVLYAMKSDIQKLIDTRNQRLLSENSGSLSGLAEQRTQQQSKISESKNAVISADAGVISCFSDGLESKYTFDVMGDLTEKDINVNSSGTVLDKAVNEGEPIFKVVRSNDWYIVSYIPNSLIENWTVGDKVSIYAHTQNEDARKLEVQVASLNTGEKTTLAVLKSTKYLVDYINVRSITFETTKVMAGLKIPNNAIVEQTMLKVSSDFVVNNKIYKKSGEDTYAELDVVPAGTNSEEGITYIPFDINRINVGDTLVMPEDKSKTFTISDVVTVKGVFVMNTGIAEFCKINLDNSSANANYTVLDPAINTNIKLYDRIVTDTKNIEKQQKLIS